MTASSRGSWQLSVGAHAAPQDLAAIDGGLERFNQSAAALEAVRALVVLARSDAGLIGGACGRSWGRCAELQQLWVAEVQRRQGLGRALVEGFEHEARRRGCQRVYLETFSFQAPGFYERLGFVRRLSIVGFAPSVEKYTLLKELAS